MDPLDQRGSIKLLTGLWADKVCRSTDRTAHLESCVSFLKHYYRICNLCMANI